MPGITVLWISRKQKTPFSKYAQRAFKAFSGMLYTVNVKSKAWRTLDPFNNINLPEDINLQKNFVRNHTVIVRLADSDMFWFLPGCERRGLAHQCLGHSCFSSVFSSNFTLYIMHQICPIIWIKIRIRKGKKKEKTI